MNISPANLYLFKAVIETLEENEICSKLTTKPPKLRH